MSCTGGRKRPLPCNNLYPTSILPDNLYEGDDLISDTIQRRLWIIFEQDFNDSISVLVDSKLYKTERIVTDRVIGVCKSSVQINYSGYKRDPLISILFLERNKCISFYPVYGKRMAYINSVEDAWSIELSNIIREYR
jgi:hypothetical protein